MSMIKYCSALIFQLYFLSSFCQERVSKQIEHDTISFYSINCKSYISKRREYLNDSVFIESRFDLSDTLMVKGGYVYILHRNVKYLMIDIDNDFKEKKYHYYYNGLHPLDTLKQINEPEEVQANRLSHYISIYIPKEKVIIKNREVYIYYGIANCYPITTECIKAKIANGQYGLNYFERDIGPVGFSSPNGNCLLYYITDQSHKLLLKHTKTLQSLHN